MKIQQVSEERWSVEDETGHVEHFRAELNELLHKWANLYSEPGDDTAEKAFQAKVEQTEDEEIGPEVD